MLLPLSFAVLTIPVPYLQHWCFLAQLKASLAEQLSVDQLRDEFRRYIKTKVAQELMDFYLDSLDREEVTGFFERQVTFKLHYCFVLQLARGWRTATPPTAGTETS